MADVPEDTNSPKPEEFLSKTQAGLNNASAQNRLNAIQKLEEQNFSSPAILHKLEEMAIKDRSKAVREAAKKILNSPTHRFIQSRTGKLSLKERLTILTEIKTWEIQGLIEADQADVIRQRYAFDIDQAESQPVTSARPSQPERIDHRSDELSESSSNEPATTKEEALRAQPKSTRPSLTQSLLSETSIKIALYLGAFFVIAAAAILAAVVESARLPILLASTALFAGGAVITRARLPQPSFALFIVFSFLLPTDANVLADILDLSGKVNAGYWFVTIALMALIWGFGTWFYASRLFSIAAFISLGISVARLSEFFDAEPEIYLLLLGLVALLGLCSVYLIKRWRSAKFSLPLFILVQLFQLGLITFALVAIAIRAEEFPSTWNLVSTVFWLLTLAFYVISDLIFPFVLFPWLSIAALFPLPINFMLAFSVEALPVAIATWVWGFFLAALSELLRRLSFEKIRRFGLPSLLGSLAVILTATLIGYIEEITYGFFFLLASAILYTILHILKPRVFLWTAALLLGLGAYFTFFALPFMENIEVIVGYQVLGASLLLLIPDLLLTSDFSTNKSWRWPLRTLGASLAFFNLSLVLPFSTENNGHVALIYGSYSLFFAAHSLRYNRAWLGYLATASAALGITFALQYFEQDTWLFSLTALSAFYYLAGFILGRIETRSSWSNMLRYSGLGLASLVSLMAIITFKESGGWYVLTTAMLFGIEMFSHRTGLAEAGLQLFLAAGAFMLMGETDLERGYLWLGVALSLLGTDLILALTYENKRPIAWFSRGFGALVIALNTLDLLLNDFDPKIGAICFGIYVLFFMAQALLYRQSVLGYSITLYAVLTTIFALRTFGQPNWMLSVTLLAAVYYLAGFLLRKRMPANSNDEEKEETFTIKDFGFSWHFILWTSGLGAGLLATLVAPLQGGLSATIPPAVLATMVAVEAFDRRNVWLGFPANALYLMAYFILLIELDVDEPQFFSIATAALGLLMHYLLTRTGSCTGAFITGMVSQLVLLSTTYIQFLSTERLVFFAVLFFQALIVLGYGVVIRSRSLVITPLVFLVLSVLSVLYGLMQGIMAVLLIGCTGLLLLMLGIAAVILRDRLKQISERFSDWGA